MFNVTFTNGQEDLTLLFKVRNTSIARKWYDELSKHYDLFETDRLDNWGKDKQYFIDLLNTQIDIINAYQPIIDSKVTVDTKQSDLNYLHKFFEDLRGEITQGTEWYFKAPQHVQDAVNNFNVQIHQLETAIKSQRRNHPTATITFKDRPRYELTEDDMNMFTYRWEKGAVYINYCHVGKPVLDAYNDNDYIAEAIRPQTHYSADFMIKFGPSTNILIYWLRKLLIARWLKKRQFNIKHLNLGMIPVADLVTKVDKETLIRYNRVKAVECTK